jgi:hypothetical protein
MCVGVLFVVLLQFSLLCGFNPLRVQRATTDVLTARCAKIACIMCRRGFTGSIGIVG